MDSGDRYLVIGNPIAHSKSPEIHADFAAQTRQNMVYERLLAPLDGFVDSVRRFIQEGGRGANVTVPFKLEAHALATVLSERAKMAGAVNTLKFEDGVIFGDNTDGAGLITDIVRNAGVPVASKKVLLVGAGGAARGVVLPLLSERPGNLTVANRTHAKAVELVRQFSGRHANIHAVDLASLSEPFDIIINATSASLAVDIPPLSSSIFSKGTLAYDMMYGKEPTVFMQFAIRHGAVARDGLGMLVEQAAESFLLWRNVRPDTATVYHRLRTTL
jgi:shikimate dehydrogenase